MSDSLQTVGAVQTVFMPHPFDAERVTGTVPEGLNLAEIVAVADVEPAVRPFLRIWINDELVPREYWHRVRPKAGAMVGLKVVPGKGGGGILRTVALLAVAAVATWATAGIMGYLTPTLGLLNTAGELTFMGTMIQGAIGGALTFVGNALVNALIPPPQTTSGNDYNPAPMSSPTYSLTGSSNRMQPYGNIPRNFGKRRVYPVLAARSYTESQGDDSYLRLLLSPGWGPVRISDIRIGNTPISAYQDVEYEIREGWDDDEPVTLYTRQIREESLSVALVNSEEWPEGEGGDWVIRTTHDGIDEFSVDISFPAGLYNTDANSGSRYKWRVKFAVQYSLEGEDDWQDAEWINPDTGFETSGIIDIYENSTSSLLRGGRAAVPVTGKYEIRLRRIGDFSGDTPHKLREFSVSTATWVALRSISYEIPVEQTGLALIAMRLKASEQLNGTPNQISCLVESYLPVWDGENWDWEISRNPAWAYTHLLRYRGPDRLVEDSRLDLDSLKAWADACDELAQDGEPKWQFDGIVEGGTVLEALRDIAPHGRGAFAMVGDRLSVTRDMAQTVPVQMITPRNSWGYQGSKTFIDPPHGLKVRFVNAEKDYQEDERIVFADGYTEDTATSFETIDMMGATSPEQVWREGRYHLAVGRLRPEKHTVNMDVETLRCAVGDLVHLSHDVIMVGLSWGRIKSVVVEEGQVVGLGFDELVTMESGKSYAVTVRRADGSSDTFSVLTASGERLEATLSTPIPEATAPAVGNLFQFGETGRISAPMVVKSIAPSNDLSASLTLVDAAPEVHAADTGEIPAFDSRISVAPTITQVPATPSILSVRSDESVLARLSDGTLQSRIEVTLASLAAGAVAAEQYEVQTRMSGNRKWEAYTTLAYTTTRFHIAPVEDDQLYDIRIRATAPSKGAASPWETVSSHLVIGKTTPPPVVTGFAINVVGDMAYLSWDKADVLDLSHYRLKFSPSIGGANWSSCADLIPEVKGTSVAVPARVGTYLIKAVDVVGNCSTEATTISSNVAGLLTYNTVVSTAVHPNWSGERDGTAVAGNTLKLTSQDMVANWGNISDVHSMSFGINGFCESGTFTCQDILDLGDVYTARVTAEVDTDAQDINNVMQTWSTLGGVERLAGDSLDKWGTTVFLRSTADDPALEPEWSGWVPLVVGDYTARAFQARLLLSSNSANVTPVVNALTLTADVPDRTESGEDLLVPAEGLRIDFASPFQTTPAVAVSGQALASGDTWALSDRSRTGFSVRFFNASGQGVERTCDYLARGYGKQG